MDRAVTPPSGACVVTRTSRRAPTATSREPSYDPLVLLTHDVLGPLERRLLDEVDRGRQRTFLPWRTSRSDSRDHAPRRESEPHAARFVHNRGIHRVLGPEAHDRMRRLSDLYNRGKTEGCPFVRVAPRSSPSLSTNERLWS